MTIRRIAIATMLLTALVSSLACGDPDVTSTTAGTTGVTVTSTSTASMTTVRATSTTDQTTLAPASTTTTQMPPTALVPRDEWINVRDHGAEGDGEADDTAAIQAAIDQAHSAGGGVVYAPAGTYALKTGTNVEGNGYNLVMKDNVAFAGDGQEETFMVGYVDWASVFGGPHADNIFIGSCDIGQASEDLQGADGIKLEDAYRPRIEQVTVHNVYIGIALYACRSGSVRNCLVHDCSRYGEGGGSGIGISRSSTLDARNEDCLVANCEAYNVGVGYRSSGGQLGEERVVYGARFVDCYVWGEYENGYMITFTNNAYFENCEADDDRRAFWVAGVETGEFVDCSYVRVDVSTRLYGPSSDLTFHSTEHSPNFED